jgi:hypothetical protein
VVSNRIVSYTKEEASTPAISIEEGEGAREAKGQSIQPIQAYDTSRERVKSQDQLPASTGQTGGEIGQTGNTGHTGGHRR